MYTVKKGGKKTLQYKSLSNANFQTAPSGRVATHGINFKAMIKSFVKSSKAMASRMYTRAWIWFASFRRIVSVRDYTSTHKSFNLVF
jgi:hypothetical protein